MSLSEQSALWNHLWQDAALLMLQLDPSGIVTKANRFSLRYVGENSVGKKFTSLLVDFTSQLDPNRVSEWQDQSFRVNLRTPAKNPVTMYMRFLPDEHGMLAVGSPDIEGLEKLQSHILHLNQDLSDLGRQLQKANAELKALNTLKNQFLGMAAHDLRTPLGAISSFSEFLRDEAGPSLSEEHREFIDIILESSKRMQSLIEDFLDVSMIEAGKLTLNRKPVTAGAILKDVRTMIDLVAKAKGVVLEDDLHDAEVPLDADGPKIGQVLINLIRNAIEYSTAEGRVWVSTRLEGQQMIFAVKDEAGGIPDEQCKQLFSAFGRAETKKTGGERSVGLGLSIAKKIVDAHGGTLSVDSTWGTGSTFTFKIPAPNSCPATRV